MKEIQTRIVRSYLGMPLAATAALLFAAAAPAEEVRQAWVRRYNGPGNGEDNVTAMVVDATGNVYLTGSSPGDGTRDDFATIKYDSCGTRLWRARYTRSGDSTDRPAALDVDSDGNVYVTGWSSTISDRKCVTISYDDAGHQRWVHPYDGPDELGSSGKAVTINGDGYIYVGGNVSREETGADYLILKYDPAGNLLLDRTYIVPRSQGFVGIGVDQTGNIFAAGTSWTESSGTDWLTVMYDSAGVLKWADWYDGPASEEDGVMDMVVDGSGICYVTGYSYGGLQITEYDYATIKYNTLGQREWVKRYNNDTLNKDDFPLALALHPSGNISVTGLSTTEVNGVCSGTTVTYDPDGTRVWVAWYNENRTARFVDVAVDIAGNTAVTGCGSPNNIRSLDYVTVKYDQTGQLLWDQYYDGPGEDYLALDTGLAVGFDAAGSVYVTGQSVGVDSDIDFATVKYCEGCEETQACCLWDGRCLDRPAPVCTAGDGTPQGPGTECSVEDYDHDGVVDTCDGCPYDPNRIEPDECGCGMPREP